MKRINLLFVFIFIQVRIFFPQNPENSYDMVYEYLEDLFTNTEKESDPEAVAEELSYLLENKMDINKTDMEDLLRIPFLTEGEALKIILHRKEYGEILSLYELKNIPELGMQTLQQILPFLSVEPQPSGSSLKNSLKHGKSQFLLRYNRFLRDKNGYVNHATASNKKYIGDPNYYYAKYLFQSSDKISLGFTAEKDAGEQAWGTYNKGADFYSFHFQLSDVDFLKRWVIGDYKINFGQGLVVGSASVIGKSTNVLNVTQRDRGLQKYSSTGEIGYFRGTGATVHFWDVDLSLFYSQNKTDANISEYELVTSFKTDGLHRIEKEIEKKRNLSETLSGGNLNYRKQHFSVGGTFIQYQYDKILQPDKKPYNLYKIQNTDSYWNGSLDYTFRTHGMNFFGELARSKGGGTAVLSGVNLYPASRLGILLLYRYYTPDYQANHANGFSENTHIENERGLYLGAEFKPVKRFKFAAYVDTYYFPWVKYNLDKPSSGYDFLTYASFYPSRNTTIYLKYKYKTKEKSGSGTQTAIFYENNTLRYGIQSKLSKRLRSHTILDGNRYFDEFKGKSYGGLIAQDFSYDFIENISTISVRYAYFHAPVYENRLYVYEKDVLYAFSIPAYYGIGHRIYVNLRFQPLPNLTCYFKYATYIYTDGRKTIGSGLEEIEGNQSSNIRCLIRYQF